MAVSSQLIGRVDFGTRSHARRVAWPRTALSGYFQLSAKWIGALIFALCRGQMKIWPCCDMLSKNSA